MVEGRRSREPKPANSAEAIWAIRDDRTLSAHAKLAYAMLWSRGTDVHPSMNTLAADMGVSKGTARKAIKELTSGGLVRVAHRTAQSGDSDTNQYFLVSPRFRIGSREAELRGMPYRQYLQTPEWQERRKGALAKAGHKCQVCNRGARELHVHHRTYERRGAEFAGDLVVLCDDCHTLFHANGMLAPHED